MTRHRIGRSAAVLRPDGIEAGSRFEPYNAAISNRHFSRRTPRRWSRFITLAVAALAVGLAGCGQSKTSRARSSPTSSSAPTTAPNTTTTFPSPPDPLAPGPLAVNGPAWTGHGEMAFVSRDQLYVLDNAGRVTKVHGPAPGGSYGSPAWSTDGSWLAFTYTTPPPGEEAGDTETALWVLRAGAPHAEQVAFTGVGAFSWSPTTSLVLAFESLDPGTNTTTLWEDVPGHRANAVPGITPFFGGFAWSPDGTHLAVSTGHAGNGHGTDLLSTLQVVPTGGGAPVTWYQTTSNVIEVGSWWPNGKGLLYWLDTDGSSSVAADGLVLYTQAAGSPPRPLATTLVDASWLPGVPTGSRSHLSPGDRAPSGRATNTWRSVTPSRRPAPRSTRHGERSVCPPRGHQQVCSPLWPLRRAAPSALTVVPTSARDGWRSGT